MPAQPRGLIEVVRRTQLYRSIFRGDPRGGDRDRVLRVSSTFFLHLHPTKVRRHAVRFRFTWGMGGISTLLLGVLAVTGVALMFHYRPAVDHAAADVRALAEGHRLLYNLHRFASHAVLIAGWLHLLRVFLTGSYKPPREFNWVVGIAILALVTAVASSGHALATGGAGLSGEGLLRAYALHCAAIPLAVAALSAVHFFRVRKDGGISGPPAAGPGAAPDLVHTWPALIRVEVRATVVVLALLGAWAALAAAPDPSAPTAPFHHAPFALLTACFSEGAARAVAAAAVLALAAIPYVDTNPAGNGFYVFRPRRFAVTTFLAAFLGLWIAPIAAAPFARLEGPTRDLPAAVGIALAPLWLVALPLAYRARVKLDPARYWIAAVSFQLLTGVAVKVALRLLAGVRYLAPGLGF